MKVAIVHDWLTGMRGGERCLEVFLRKYPEADLFTMVHVPGKTSRLIDERVRGTSFLQSFPGIATWYRHCLALYPSAIRSLELSEYDLVISLSHAAAKNIVLPKSTVHLSYCFTPMRYVWDQAETYFGRLTPALWPLILRLRRWDLAGGARPSEIVAISRFVAARIRCFYGRDSSVVYPPVDTKWIRPCKKPRQGEAFLYAGALVPYKRVDLVIEAFNRLDVPLWIVGTGPDEARLRKMAKPHVNFFGRVDDVALGEFLRHCRALVMPGVEDFGLLPVECMAAGRPVIALDDGGVRESIVGVRPWRTDSQSLKSELRSATGVLIRKVRDVGSGGDSEIREVLSSIRFFLDHEGAFSSERCVERAAEFSVDRFSTAWDLVAARHGVPPRGEPWNGPEAQAVGERVGLG